MAGQRDTIEFTVEGQTIAALTAGPAAGEDSQGKPLIAALHGGTYTACYYDVAGPAPRGVLGPAGSWPADAVQAAHGSYALTPVRELIQAPQWPDEHLPGLAPRITVPVHNALAEFDALWDSTPANVEQFAKLLTAAPFV